MTDAQVAPRFAIVAVDCFERPVRLRLPFRFGNATVSEAPQAFVRATLRLADGRLVEGWSAELMIPKWFDKTLQRTNDENFGDLRRAVAHAARAYAGDTRLRSAFGHAAAHYASLLAAGAAAGLNPLLASYGPALVDRAVFDALARGHELPLHEAIRRNLPGIDATLTPDLEQADIDGALAAAGRPERIALRHTVGLVDPLTPVDVLERPPDALPVALTEVVARYHPRYFKLKLCGDPEADARRVIAIGAILAGVNDVRFTLDGNEQYRDLAVLDEFFVRLRCDESGQELLSRVLYLEQPLPRDASMVNPVAAQRFPVPLIIDEADATMDAFPRARAAGYAGVSSKDCKGFYKALLNAARCRRWNADGGGHWFLAGEDLTAQAGLAVQQDLALVALLGLRHVERNGHHYADGFAAQGAPAAERDGFFGAHPGLYVRDGDNVRVAIDDGEIDLRSLDVPGFGTAFRPQPSALPPMPLPAG